MKHFMRLAIVAGLAFASYATAVPAGNPQSSSATIAPDKPKLTAPAEVPQFRYASVFVMRPLDADNDTIPAICPPHLDTRTWRRQILVKREQPFIARPPAVARSTI